MPLSFRLPVGSRWTAARLLPLLVLGALLGTPDRAHGQDDLDARAAAVLERINLIRGSRDLPTVALDARLGSAAQSQAEAMARTGRLQLAGSAGETLEDRLRGSGYAYVQAAANIAAGQSDPDALIDDWMASPNHRANMLDPDVAQIGVGYAFRQGDAYGHYWALVMASPARSAADTAGAAGVGESLLAEVNRVRRNHGLTAVRLSVRLDEAARVHTRYLVSSGRFTHEGPNGESVADRAVAAGYAYRFVAENIAAGQADAAEVIVAWMNSPGHRANLLNPTIIEIGVGYAFRADAPYHHYWTLVLAAPR